MKVVFLQRDSFVKIAVEQLSAVLKANGYDCDLFIETGERRFIKSALKSNADLFAFSCTTSEANWVLRTAELLKEKCSVPVLVGGPHPTFYPRFIENSAIDFICRGEGEDAIIDLLRALEHDPQSISSVPNIWSKNSDGSIVENQVRPLIQDLDTLPYPDFEIYAKYRYMVPYSREMFPDITSRGCPYDCSYCFNRALKELYRDKGKYLRRRSPEHVIEELCLAKEKYGIRKINFVDDAFLLYPQWIREFAEPYKKKVNLPFVINVEPTHVAEELVRIVKEMGCFCIRMGLESGNEDLRQIVLNKKVATEQIKQAAKYVKKYGMKLATFNILGLPGETVEKAMETYKLNREIGSDFIECTLLQPYPGTGINEYVREHGFLEDDNTRPELEASCFVSSGIKLENEKEIINLQKLMQVFAQLRVPLFLVRKIIKLPRNPFFHLLLKLSFVYSKMRTQKIRFFPLVILGLHSLSYMKADRAKGS